MSNELLPVQIRTEFLAIDQDLAAYIKMADAASARHRKVFISCLVALLCWFVFGPFVGQPAFHFVVEALGAVFIALATGSLRVLRVIEECKASLNDVRNETLRLRDEVGYNHAEGAGDVIKIANLINNDPQYLTALRARVSAMSAKMGAVRKDLSTSVFEAYMELFSVLQKRQYSTPPPKGA